MLALAMFFAMAPHAHAVVLTFDDAISGATSYTFDGDGDSIDDVIFSTSDPLGFNTVGPGPNQMYIDEPGLEGTTLLNPDLRVDFLIGAYDHLNFGFALDVFQESADAWTSFEVYDQYDNLLASDFEYGLYTMPNGTDPSSFPEGRIETTFAGKAAYALFNFSNDSGGGQRYIIDNFEGKFGSTEVLPEPATLLLLGFGLAGVGVLRKRR
jgi:hypothetical protein